MLDKIARFVDAGVQIERRQQRFQRVHRSHVVNLDAVQHLRAHEDRRLRIVLRNGSEVVASRAASEELRKLAR